MPDASSITRVGVVGLGTMGAGIAEVCARGGLDVVAFELGDAEIAAGEDRIHTSLERALEREKVTQAERDAALARLAMTSDLDELAACGAVIEAVTEDLETKLALIGELDGVVAKECLIATNTSALSVTALARGSAHPNRVVGMHFFNPAPVLALVEVVKTALADQAFVDLAEELVRRIGKTPIVCGDTPGFVVNRILIPVLNDAVRTLEEGTADAASIDTAMTLGVRWPIGPLALIDLIGVDVHVHASEALWEAYRETRFAPPARLVRMLDAGHLGRKSGKGFFEYGSG